MPPAVEVRGLGRIYRSQRKAPDTLALRDIDLLVEEGEIHGLLGPNGAGKTTLVKILSTVLLPTSGSAHVLGCDVATQAKRVRADLGVVFGGERGLYTRVTARQNLMFWSALYRIDRRTAKVRCEELLERVGLADRADDPVEKFSRGMKQRLHLARGLVHDPRVLFLDEPTSGMDPLAAHAFRDLVRDLRTEGRTVFLTTHDMAEAEALCGRVSLIDRGRLVLSEPTAEVGRYLGTGECVEFTCDDKELVEQVGLLPGVENVLSYDEEQTAWRAFPKATTDTAELLVWLVQRGVLSARRSEPTLEEVYLRVVGARGMSV